MPNLPPLAPGTTKPSAAKPNKDTDVEKASVRSSVRSQKSVGSAQGVAPAAPEQTAGDDKVERASQRSVPKTDKSVGSASVRSITSSVALQKLAQLEEMLVKERQAREQAENTLLALQRERIAREEATKQSQVAQRQLTDVLSALRTVVLSPDEPANVRKLQKILQGRTNSGDDTASTRSAASSNQNNNAPRSFLDGMGQYERERKREQQKEKDQRK